MWKNCRKIWRICQWLTCIIRSLIPLDYLILTGWILLQKSRAQVAKFNQLPRQGTPTTGSLLWMSVTRVSFSTTIVVASVGSYFYTGSQPLWCSLLSFDMKTYTQTVISAAHAKSIWLIEWRWIGWPRMTIGKVANHHQSIPEQVHRPIYFWWPLNNSLVSYIYYLTTQS